MYCYCSQTLIRLLRRHLPRRGRQSAAAGMGGQGRPPLRVQRKPKEAGGQSRPPLRVRWEIGEAGGQGRPPLRVRRKIVGTGAECVPLRRAIF